MGGVTRGGEGDGTSTIELVCWNVRCPSAERALRQLEWLDGLRADVVLLTECRETKASRLHHDFFTAAGFDVFFSAPDHERDYCVLLASRIPVVRTHFADQVAFLRPRLSSVRTVGGAEIEIIGVYAPSRGFDTADRARKKRRFIDGLAQALAARGPAGACVVFGDLNVLEPGHVPHYRHFEEWEYAFYADFAGWGLTDAFRHLHGETLDYSWHGRSGNGYRYDHCFVSNDLLAGLERCEYIHQPRTLGLSDHSAMVLDLSVVSSGSSPPALAPPP